MDIKDSINLAQFGSRFVTTEGKEAVFLRFAENAEHKFAIFYVKDWGTVQVFRDNGREVHGESKYDIIARKAWQMKGKFIRDLAEQTFPYDREKDCRFGYKLGLTEGEVWGHDDAVDKAVEWLNENLTNNPSGKLCASNYGTVTKKTLIDEFKKAMED